MPLPRAMIKKMKRKEKWISARQKWPEIGQTVKVMATIVTTATLLQDKPHRIWNVHTPQSECEEVKFWSEIDEERRERSTQTT